MFVTRNIKLEREVERGVENLSEEARNSLNYDELLTDVKAKFKGEELVYATKEDTSGINKITALVSEMKNKHIGKGYYYKEVDFSVDTDKDGRMVVYSFCSSVDDTKIYSKKDNSDTFDKIIIAIIFIGIISCFIIYKKEKVM
ncbi:MAG: hypothetical protein IKE01_04800 [Clostridia bacterium]|nr:hypothetical protein [Clostridia bacterium]